MCRARFLVFTFSLCMTNASCPENLGLCSPVKYQTINHFANGLFLLFVFASSQLHIEFQSGIMNISGTLCKHIIEIFMIVYRYAVNAQ